MGTKLAAVIVGTLLVAAGCGTAISQTQPTTTVAPVTTPAPFATPVTLEGTVSCGLTPATWIVVWKATGPAGATVSYSNLNAPVAPVAWSGWQGNTATAIYSSKMRTATMTVMMRWAGAPEAKWPSGAPSNPVVVSRPPCAG